MAKIQQIILFFGLYYLITPVFCSSPSNVPVFTQGAMKCPGKFRSELFVFKDPFVLTKQQNEVVKGISSKDCFRSCRERRACAAAIYEPDSRACALALILETNIDLLCEEFNNKKEFDEKHKLSSLNCTSGCQAMKKVCESCADTPLSVAVAFVYCRRRGGSVEDYCNAVQPIAPPPKKPSPPIQAQEEAKVMTEAQPRQNEQKSPTQDNHIYCCFWARIGECDANPFWMRPHCPQSCGTPDCKMESALECKVNLNISACSRLLVPVLQPVLHSQPQPKPQSHAISHTSCVDYDVFCNSYASVGHCIARSRYIAENCRATCKYC